MVVVDKCIICGKEHPYQEMKCKVRVKGLRAIIDYYCPDCILYMQDRDRVLPEPVKRKKKAEEKEPKQDKLERCCICGEMYPIQEIRARVELYGMRPHIERYCLSCFKALQGYEEDIEKRRKIIKID